VDKGKISNDCIEPELLISLTVPKIGCKNFKGKHILGIF
jgi:hypothetical protein